MASELSNPIHNIQHRKYARKRGWRLDDISLCSSGRVAVSGGRPNRSFVCIYGSTVDNSDSSDKPTLLYHKQFTDNEYCWDRCTSFLKPNSAEVVTCRHYEVQVIDYNRDVVLRYRKVDGWTTCLSVNEGQIFIALHKSVIVNIYDNDLNRIKSIRLREIEDDWVRDVTVAADRLYVRTRQKSRAIAYSMNGGNILTEYTSGQDKSDAYSIAVNTQLGLIAVLWYHNNTSQNQIILYLFYENKSFLTVNVEYGVYRIRISDQGRIATGNEESGEVKIYDLDSVITFRALKEFLVSRLEKSDCEKLIHFFAMGGEELNRILNSIKPAAALLLALEEKSVIQPYNVDILEEAFAELNLTSPFSQVVNIYQKLRDQTTSYDRFLATLSTHLTSSVPANLCNYFNVSEEQKDGIISSPNPGLTLLLVLDEMGIIKSSEVGSLEGPFEKLRLIQAVAKIHQYQVHLEEEKRQLSQISPQSLEEKRAMFVEVLKKKIKGWYETMTPVPWKRSCQWKSTDLFVGSGLILTDSKAKQSVENIDEKCKLNYKEILNHEKLKSEKRIILEGDPGSGKTMLSSQLAYDWSQGKINGVDILIFLPLKLFEDETLIQAVKEFYIPTNVPISEKDIEDILASSTERTCLLLDGLEEYSGGGRHRGKESSELMKIMKKEKHSNCKVVITTRSGFAQDLPKYPLLKIGRFGETERNSYITQLSPEDTHKQENMKSVIKNNQFILDLCNVPLLFVLAVHNLDSMTLFEEGQLNKVSPFMRSIILTLCSATTVKHEVDGIPFEILKSEKITLGELAFNGLCKGRQQLSWQKDFMESNVSSFKLWVDSGVLVLEEGFVIAEKKDHNVPETIEMHEKESPGPSTSSDIPQTSASSEMLTTAMGAPSDSRGALEMGQTHQSVSKLESDPDVIGEKTVRRSAYQVPLVVKFLHKVIQEWFAATFFSSMTKSCTSAGELQTYVFSQLQHIRPGDLHYVLRFTSYLHPQSCHHIMNYLLRSYRKNGHVPPHILNCVFLCFNEHNDVKGLDMRNVVEDVCKEVITIQAEDSRLLQQAKSSLLEYASSNGVIIENLELKSVIWSVHETTLTLNSGVQLEILDTVKIVEVSRWDRRLQEDDYKNILKLLSTVGLVKEIYCDFPSKPPECFDEITLTNFITKDIKVEWRIGHCVHLLDPREGKWTESFEQPGNSTTRATMAITEQACYTAQKMITTKTGGMLEISNTGIALFVPPNALPVQAQEESHQIKIRYIPRSEVKDQSQSFSSNSTAVVEILPALKLNYPVRLSLPHCLVLQQNLERKARIFVSHHDKGVDPLWKEEKEVPYHVEDTNCIIFLNSFSWYTFSIGDEVVRAKKIVVYAAAQKLRRQDDVVRIEVGCYPDLPKEDMEIPGGSNLLVAHKKILYFEKREEQYPLRISLIDIFPSGWRCSCHCPIPNTHSQEIPYNKISFGLGGSCVYILEKTQGTAGRPLCVFTASQEKGDLAVQLAVNLQVLDKVSSRTGNMGNESGSLQNAASASATINKAGRELEIEKTGVVLKILPNTFKGDVEVQMRIIPSRTMEDQVTFLCSNSCTAVEILPHNIRLRKPAELRLPHCLIFNAEISDRTARIFTNHEKGNPAKWEEDTQVTHTLDENACIIKLNKLCCVKYFIDDKIVKGKKIRVYTATREVEQNDEVAEIEVGYYPDFLDGGELLRMNPSFKIDSKDVLLFMGEGKSPLQLSLDNIVPSRWIRWFPKDNPWEIPFEVAASSIERSHLFILQKTIEGVGSVICLFTALQKEGGVKISLALTLLQKVTQRSEDRRKSLKDDSENLTIKLLSRKLTEEWIDVCRSLGVEESELFRQETDNKGNIKEAIYQSFLSWKQSKGEEATFKSLRTALEENGRSDLAKDIEKYEELF